MHPILIEFYHNDNVVAPNMTYSNQVLWPCLSIPENVYLAIVHFKLSTSVDLITIQQTLITTAFLYIVSIMQFAFSWYIVHALYLHYLPAKKFTPTHFGCNLLVVSSNNDTSF